VPYQKGTLKAIAWKGKRTFTNEISTTGNPVSVKIDCIKTVLKADGKDAAVINISVVDSKGNEVPDAGNLISFTMDGNAEIIGVGNGDPSDHDADKCADGKWQRHLFNGKAQIIIQSGKNVGECKFTAASDGLKNTVLMVSCK